MRKYKVGDWVIYIDKKASDWWKKLHGISLYGKIAKIIKIPKGSGSLYVLEFKDQIKNNLFDNTSYSTYSAYRQFISLNSLKLKKFLE